LLVHDIMDVNAVHQFITGGIMRVMDVFAPLKDISVKDGNNVYLSKETLSMMRVCDTAKGNAYCKAKNHVTALVRRDKILANTKRLAESKNCPHWYCKRDLECGHREAATVPAGVSDSCGWQQDSGPVGCRKCAECALHRQD
jgi:hypothetical protein